VPEPLPPDAKHESLDRAPPARTPCRVPRRVDGAVQRSDPDTRGVVGEAVSMRTRGVAGFLGLAAGTLVVLFHDAVWNGYILGQTDFLFKFLPWSAHAPVGWRVRNPLMGDIPMQFYPWAVHARQTILSGHFPLWNRAAGAGEPFFAAIQTQVLSPFTLLIYALPFPGSLTAVAATRLLVGGLGMFLFLRRQRLSEAAAVFGGIAYLLNPFSILGLEHPTAAVAAWLPWMLLAADHCAVEGTRRSAALMATVVALAVLSGHPESFQNSALLTAGYAIYRGIATGRLARTLRLAAVGGVVGVLVASVQLLPFLEYVRGSHTLALRAGAPALLAANPLASFVTAFVPDFYGTPTGRGYVLGGTNYVAQLLYPGLAMWLFASVGVCHRRHRGTALFFLAAAAIATAITFGTVVARILAVVFPPLRMTLLYGFGLIAIASLVIAAAIGFDGFLDAVSTHGKRALTQAATMATAATVIGMIVFAFWRGQQGLLVDSRLAVHTLRSISWTGELLAGLVIIAFTARWLGREAVTVLVLAVLVTDLLVFADGFHALIPPTLAFPPVPELAPVTEDRSVVRVAGWLDTLLPNTAMMYGLQDFRGYDALGVGPYSELLDAGFFFNGATHQLVNASSAPLLDLLNVKYVLTPPDVSLPADHFEQISPGPTAIYRNRGALERAFLVSEIRVITGRDALRQLRAGEVPLRRQAVVDAPFDAASMPDASVGAAGDAISIRRYADEDVVIETSAAGRRLLVLLDAYYPGWVATVDRADVPIHRVDYAFRGVVIPPGHHVVEFQYRPWSVRAGAALSLASLATIGWMLRRTARSS
jgi:Bacterial membrane protein YfhO